MNEYYNEITQNEFFDIANWGTSWCNFTPAEISFLNNKTISYSHISFCKGFYAKDLRIYKLPDEWFFVATFDAKLKTEKYYKCDQLEGLITLLNDITYE